MFLIYYVNIHYILYSEEMDIRQSLTNVKICGLCHPAIKWWLKQNGVLMWGRVSGVWCSGWSDRGGWFSRAWQTAQAWQTIWVGQREWLLEQTASELGGSGLDFCQTLGTGHHHFLPSYQWCLSYWTTCREKHKNIKNREKILRDFCFSEKAIFWLKLAKSSVSYPYHNSVCFLPLSTIP